MDIKLHKLARTTPATRRYIQTAPKSAATLARELGVAVTTIYKWKRAGRVHDGLSGTSSMPASPEQEALSTQLRLSLDDVTEMNRCYCDALSRSAIHRCRCWASHGCPPLPPTRRRWGGSRPPPAYIHLDLKVLSKLQKQPSYVFVAIDRATRYVWVKVGPADGRHGDAGRRRILAAFPHKVHTILTDNDGAFTDRFAVHKQGKPAGQPSGTHRLDHVCRHPSPDPPLSSADRGGTTAAE